MAEYGVADWELSIQGDNQTIKTVTGAKTLEPVLALSLDDIGRDKLAACSNLQAHIKVTDTNQDTFTRLEEAGELSPELAGRLRSWAGYGVQKTIDP